MAMTKSIAFICLLAVWGLISNEIADSDEEMPPDTRRLSVLTRNMHQRCKTIAGPIIKERDNKDALAKFYQEREKLRKQVGEAVGTLKGQGYSPGQKELNKSLFRAAYCSPDLITQLIEWGANKDARNRKGRTPVMCACLHGNHVALALLIRHGADVQLSDYFGKRALDYATPGGVRLEAKEWPLLRLHETEEVRDPRAKCREIIEKKLEDDKHLIERRQKQLDAQRKRVDSVTDFGQSETITHEAKRKGRCLIL